VLSDGIYKKLKSEISRQILIYLMSGRKEKGALREKK